MNRLIKQLALALALLALAGCGAGQPATPTSAVSGAIPGDARITLERTVCYGACPSYVVTIAADGAVGYQGREFVETVGAAEGSITTEELRGLIRDFEAIDYWSYLDEYGSDPKNCPTIATDSPSAITSLTLNGKTKRVSHYSGCIGFKGEAGLAALEKKIDDVARTSRWVGK